MTKTAINKSQTQIHVFLSSDDKKAFARWCESNGLSMSEVIREEIKSKIDEGYKIK